MMKRDRRLLLSLLVMRMKKETAETLVSLDLDPQVTLDVMDEEDVERIVLGNTSIGGMKTIFAQLSCHLKNSVLDLSI